MSRERKGFIVSRLFLKLEFTDERVKRIEKTERAKSRTHAFDLISAAKKRWPDARGSITSRLYARLHHTDERGRRREIMRRAEEAADLARTAGFLGLASQTLGKIRSHTLKRGS